MLGRVWDYRRAIPEGAAKNPSAPALPVLPLPEQSSIAVLPFANNQRRSGASVFSSTAWSSRSSPRSPVFAGCS